MLLHWPVDHTIWSDPSLGFFSFRGPMENSILPILAIHDYYMKITYGFAEGKN